MSKQSQAEGAGIRRDQFGKDFKWGVSVSAYQIEGAHNAHGKGPSIWDIFTNKRGKVLSGHNGNHACNFYHTYPQDLQLLKSLGIPNFRFSLSWPRIMADGIHLNQQGIDFYDRLIDECLALNVTPWVTLYHWDLPHELEKKGGWTNREMIRWFGNYVQQCAERFGDRVKHWMVLNEPMVFTGAGYFLGAHAPGRRGLKNFIPAMHHACLCQAEGGRILRSMIPGAEVGTTFSCSHIDPFRPIDKDIRAAQRVDALLNRLFIEPSLGLGYPTQELKPLKSVEKLYHPNDEDLLKFDFDFIGVQNYTREVVKHSFFTPYLQASIIPAPKRKVPHTLMKWEIYPACISEVLKKFSRYEGVKKIYITENGAAFPDLLEKGSVKDILRTKYLQDHITEVYKAKAEGARVEGYFVWSFLDNFEWSEGYHPRFGIVHVDYETQQRTVKDSAKWYSAFLKGDYSQIPASQKTQKQDAFRDWKDNIS